MHYIVRELTVIKLTIFSLLKLQPFLYVFMHPFIHQILKPEGGGNTFKLLQYKNIIA